ncbi:transcriptional regulator, LacI family [Candidatus Vecturithrix granuli]|uniref:Transcriptional regulator, LacI family n=1 Tax=Vecturithrix granuli TaxID=1499967 RepID=A0A0S6W760_VECG1|nr:transcriptional regulator, LacI family [Candidatus Vecturithrix granuli]
MSTIKDVANLAQVSIATVSRVLNNTGPVRSELEERVLDAVRKLSYQPNKMARSLRRSESLTIGVLIPDSRNPFFAELAKGIEDTCAAVGYTVVLCNTDEQTEKAIHYLNTLYQQRVAGLIVVSPGQIAAHLQRLLDRRFPLVIADRPLPLLETDSVVADNYSGACQAMQHLLGSEHRRIGLIVSDRYLETVRLRWAGVEDTLRMAGIALDNHLIYSKGDFLPQSGYAGAEMLLKQEHPPTAIFAFNDLMAYGVLHYAQTNGWQVPEGLAVIGFDDIMMSSYTNPSLSTVAQPKYELGQKAAEMLLRRFQQSNAPFQQIVLPTSLIVRASTSAAVKL